MKTWLKTTLFDMIPLLLGVSTALAFAPFSVFPLALFAPAAMLIVINNASPKRAFWLGWVYGLGFYGAGVYWVYISVHQYGNIPAIPASLLILAMVMILALYPATIYGLLNRWFKETTTAKIIFAFPAFWVLTEWFRTVFVLGFPWLYLGYSQVNTPLSGFAPILGVYGVSFFALLTGSLLLNAALNIRKQSYFHTYLSLFICLSIWVTGELATLIPWTQSTGKQLTVSMVQGNIPQSMKWSAEHINLSYKRYQKLTQPLWGKSDLIIWPEAAIPVPLQDNTVFIDRLAEKAKESGSELLLGIPVQNPNGNGYYNALIAVGKSQDMYLKRVLVPFGEFTPFEKLLKPLSDYLAIPMSGIIAGKMDQPPIEINGVKILPAICFEIAFPELMRTTEDIGMILTITNDAWFGKSSAQAQHLEIGKMRALEMGRPVLFASNNGLTAIIDPHGRITESATPYETTVLSATLSTTTGMTPWMYNGSDPTLFTLFVFIGIAIKLTRKKRAAKELPDIATQKL